MARAQFQSGQKVWVECVGAWAKIERINPVWAKGFDEPVRLTYDVGLGREFLAHELAAPEEDPTAEGGLGQWRMMRARNKWQAAEDVPHHPFPGTYPVIVTDSADWGGWRVPGAEYDRDPHRIEMQARAIAATPQLLALAEQLLISVDQSGGDAPPEMVRLAGQAHAVLRQVTEVMVAPTARRQTNESSNAA